MTFRPDDFADMPYVGGLNQMGHAMLGAALVTVLSSALPLWIAFALSLTIIWLWEGYQLWHKAASVADFVWDTIYWSGGSLLWTLAVNFGWVSGWGLGLPLFALIAWVMEFTRLSARK